MGRVTDTCGGLAKALGSIEGSKNALVSVGALGDGTGESQWAQRLVSLVEEGTVATGLSLSKVPSRQAARNCSNKEIQVVSVPEIPAPVGWGP